MNIACHENNSNCLILYIFQTFSYEAQSEAYKYLANYHLKQGRIDAAQTAAQKCSEFTEVDYFINPLRKFVLVG